MVCPTEDGTLEMGGVSNPALRLSAPTLAGADAAAARKAKKKEAAAAASAAKAAAAARPKPSTAGGPRTDGEGNAIPDDGYEFVLGGADGKTPLKVTCAFFNGGG
jgi:hypothetical protein